MEEGPIVDHLKQIFTAALRRVDPYAMLRERLALEGGTLVVGGGGLSLETSAPKATYKEPALENGAPEAAGGRTERFDLGRYERIVALGVGKASARMAQAVEEILGGRLAGGLVAVPAGASIPLRRVKLIEAGHPVPDGESARAGREMARLAREGDERTLFVNLISGGGSALLAAPLEWEDGQGRLALSLEEKRETTRLLLASGAAIQEFNCVRKHLSMVKGGRLAALMHPAESLNLILSDVVGDRLDTIASGLTSPDETTYRQARAVLRKYGLEDRLPAAARAVLEAGEAGRIPETPKPGDPVFRGVHNVLIGTNRSALLAARSKAEELGYRTAVLSSRLTGEAREAARVLLGIGQDIGQGGLLPARPACLLAGGETTVTVRGKGRGGRNQEMALAFLAGMAEDPAGSSGLYFLAASTDGRDGPTDAAGAFATPRALQAAGRAGLDAPAYLAGNDSYGFFDRIGFLYRTGPTHTNVCDIQVLLAP